MDFMKEFILVLSCCFLFINLAAQSSYQTGFLPSINLTKKMPADFKVNLKIESRQELKSGRFDIPSEVNYSYILTDFALVTAKKVGINSSIAAGYLLRFRNGEMINRSIQQFILTQKFRLFRLSHRLSADQTFVPKEPTEFRVRYRLSSQIPLNGLAVDPQEFYVKFNHEYLNAWEGQDYDLEIRIGPFLGYEFLRKKKLEVGLDYRLDSFLKGSSRHRFWLAVNLYHSFE